MRLAVVGKYPPHVDGVTEYGRHVVGGLAKHPSIDEITVIANQSVGLFDDVEARIQVRRVWKSNEAGLALRVLRELTRLKPDAVWFNVSFSMFGDSASSLGGFALPALTRALGIRSVVTLHERRVDNLWELGVSDSLSRRLGLRVAQRLLLLSDVLCVTTDAHRRVLDRCGMPRRARIVYLPLCGYDEPAFEKPREPPTVLMLTSHAPHKNLLTLIEAFRRIRHRVDNAQLVVAGIDHPRFPGYLAEMRRRHLAEPGIEWRGQVAAADLRDTFSQATVVVAPYQATAGSSATVHQAINVGRPVVVADLRELRSMAEEEQLWLEFFPPGNPTGLATVLESLLTSSARRVAMARHNLASAKRNSLTATIDRYGQLFAGESGRAGSAVSVYPFTSGARSP